MAAAKPKGLLSKIGHGLLNIFHFGESFAPALAMIPGAAPYANILGIVAGIEAQFREIQKAAPGAKFGPDKLKQALPLVKDALLASNQLAGHSIIDPQGFEDGCIDLINGAVKVMNAVDQDLGKKK